MKKVLKYPFLVAASQTLSIPHGFKICHVGGDPSGILCMWAEVDPDKAPQPVQLFVVGTGHPIPAEATRHLRSFLTGSLVWHVYTTAHTLNAENQLPV